jgi:glycerophosphoryl diester phosphodiesterase
MTHQESIELFKKLGVKMTPELKSASVTMPFNGFTQEAYAQKLIDEYKAAGVSPRDVWPQSFSQSDILYWIQREPAFGRQAVYLDDANNPQELPGLSELAGYKALGINIVGPPTFALLDPDGANNIVPSQYARDAKAAGLDIITWTLERSGILADGNNDFYYQTFDSAIHREGDLMRVLDVLARDVGILGVFSDWAAPVTYYANCMGPEVGPVQPVAHRRLQCCDRLVTLRRWWPYALSSIIGSIPSGAPSRAFGPGMSRRSINRVSGHGACAS